MSNLAELKYVKHFTPVHENNDTAWNNSSLTSLKICTITWTVFLRQLCLASTEPFYWAKWQCVSNGIFVFFILNRKSLWGPSGAAKNKNVWRGKHLYVWVKSHTVNGMAPCRVWIMTEVWFSILLDNDHIYHRGQTLKMVHQSDPLSFAKHTHTHSKWMIYFCCSSLINLEL